MIISFAHYVAAGVVVGLILYFVCKWLDRKIGDD